jgi:chromosome segregation ATPase
MPANGNETMLERLERIETRLDGVEVRLDGVEVRLDRVEVRLDRVEVRLDRVEVRLDRVETKVDGLSADVKDLGARVDGLAARTGRVEIQLEDLRETVDKFTNTMGARFDAIDRRLEENQKQFMAKVLDHERVLANHSQRITTLERRPRRRT